MNKKILFLFFAIAGAYFYFVCATGCAQISAPTGGPKDTLAPVLVRSTPEINKVNFTGNKISITFDEYIEIQELQNNLLISPLQKNNPVISYNLKTVNIRFRDTLLPNTTYSVNFGNAIRDVHEGNILRNFTYVFSTGATLDSLELSGNVLVANTGEVDSTIIVMLYKNLSDTAVLKTKPDYMARLDGKGNFRFTHLAGTNFNIYALKDGDNGRTYNSKSEIFAFIDSTVNPLENKTPIRLFAYAEEQADNTKPPTILKAPAEKRLRVTAIIQDQTFDILQPLEINFNSPLKIFDSTAVTVTDSSFNLVPANVTLDSNRKKLTIRTAWQPAMRYLVVIPQTAAEDSAGNRLEKPDTTRINTKALSDYGRVVFRFTNLDLSKNPVIQFVQNDQVKSSFPVTAREWRNDQFPPGEYSIRILYDENRNGKWDPGSYTRKVQPEKAVSLEQPLTIRADWDNERDIQL